MQKIKRKETFSSVSWKKYVKRGEVDFLVIKEDEFFHVFWGKQVIEVLTNNYEVENSKARGKNQMDDQKVIFKVNGKTYGEIEMRNDSDIHYREIKFWIDKKLTFNLLKSNINKIKKLNDRIILYGKAINKLSKIHNRREK